MSGITRKTMFYKKAVFFEYLVIAEYQQVTTTVQTISGILWKKLGLGKQIKDLILHK